MPIRPIFTADSTNEPRLPQLGAAHWRRYLALLALFGAIAFVIAAPLADRTFVPSSFVEPTMWHDSAADYSENHYTEPENVGQPAISIPPLTTDCLTPQC